MSIVKKALARKAASKARQQGATIAQTQAVENNKPESDISNQVKAEFDMQKIGMEADLAQLKQFSTIEEKDQYKSEALKNNNHLEYVEKYVASGGNHPNIILAWVFIWLIDLKRWTKALELLPLMVSQQQPLPTVFNTKHWGVFVADQLYTEGALQLEKGLKSIEQTQITQQFIRFIALIEQQKYDLGDIVGGKVYAMAGKLEQVQHNYGNALKHYVTATSLNDKAGVKKSARDIAKNLNIEIDI
ncbi:phage terminase small subunit [Thalassotalea sp. 1_MG-2023]|uniref:phage terminase small subunit n=1 Tax=Thalassotalea sp. 1_MG-2023 TaxID=3062680 RepID=UPI0026E3E1BE|nr:phage terminase small subunit [Thalassotalea sp. 1_MG-2023]MDO6426230.1 phage terminase small subunit [Thalassotalea sp. 1_MG-2023]